MSGSLGFLVPSFALTSGHRKKDSPLSDRPCPIIRHLRPNHMRFPDEKL